MSYSRDVLVTESLGNKVVMPIALVSSSRHLTSDTSPLLCDDHTNINPD
jgi:hypothetical protein